jgi:luciferase family oxidoreductase group 1
MPSTDRANARAGQAESAALHGVIERAQHAEALGFHRFWVAEHHGVPGIAGSAPAILMAVIAGATHRLRVGSGGIMLPNHQPLVVGQQTATLDNLFPGRIDVGLGRSLGFTPAVRTALRTGRYGDQAFGDDIAELRAFLDGTAAFTSRPRPAGRIPLFVLATRRGAAMAAAAGPGVVLGGPVPRDAESAREAACSYWAAFRPSDCFPQPYVVASVNAMAAPTSAAAADLLLPEAWALARSRTHGEFRPLQPVNAVRAKTPTARERSLVDDHLDSAVHGTSDDVGIKLAELAAARRRTRSC